MSESTADPFPLDAVPMRFFETASPMSGTGPVVAAYRCRFRVDETLEAAELRLTAEGRYHAWLDGEYLGRGPTPHHPFEAVFDAYPVLPRLGRGEHVLAVLLMDPGLPTLYHVPSEPAARGLRASLPVLGDGGQWRDLLTDDPGWRASRRTGFHGRMPRRTLVIDQIEHFDQALSQPGWQKLTFDDSGWDRPATRNPPASKRESVINQLPALRRTRRPAAALLDAFRIDDPPKPLPAPAIEDGTFGAPGLVATAGYGKQLMGLTWHAELGDIEVKPTGDDPAGPIAVAGLTGAGATGAGVALVLDLGAEYVGEPYLEIESESPGTIDLGFAESLDAAGRPQLMMKEGSYANRVTAAGGRLNYEAIRYSGMRYLAVVLRGFRGSVTIHGVGVAATEADLSWPEESLGGDAELSRLFALCTRTLRLGAQETLVDCPTREQSTYLGDAHAMARWVWTLTGDTNYWKRLVCAQFARAAPNGLIRTTVFSAGSQILLDYCLLGVVGTRDYFRATGDRETVRSVLPAARGLVEWFGQRLDARGFCTVDHEALPRDRRWETRYDPDQPTCDKMQILFIDHAGMGWHNLGQAGIDRRGLNTALQALLCMAEDALATLEDVAGEDVRASTLRNRAEQRRRASDVFYDALRRCYVDGLLDGKPHQAASQQTNVWAALAGWGGPERAAAVLRSRFKQSDQDSAVCGPYFWVYTAAALKQAGLENLMLDRVRELWRPMLDQGASALWETFAGDELDSRCHPWSAAPIDVVFHGLFGLPMLGDQPGQPAETDAHREHAAEPQCVLRPSLVGLGDMQITCHTRHGKIHAQWRSSAGANTGELHLRGPETLNFIVLQNAEPLRDSGGQRGRGSGVYRLTGTPHNPPFRNT